MGRKVRVKMRIKLVRRGSKKHETIIGIQPSGVEPELRSMFKSNHF